MKQLFFDAAGGTVEPEFIKRLGATAENMLTEMEYTQVRRREPRSSTTSYKAKYGVDITGNGAYSYQAGYVIAEALERAGVGRPGQAARRPGRHEHGRRARQDGPPDGRSSIFGADGQNAERAALRGADPERAYLSPLPLARARQAGRALTKVGPRRSSHFHPHRDCAPVSVSRMLAVASPDSGAGPYVSDRKCRSSWRPYDFSSRRHSARLSPAASWSGGLSP